MAWDFRMLRGDKCKQTANERQPPVRDPEWEERNTVSRDGCSVLSFKWSWSVCLSRLFMLFRATLVLVRAQPVASCTYSLCCRFFSSTRMPLPSVDLPYVFSRWGWGVTNSLEHERTPGSWLWSKTNYLSLYFLESVTWEPRFIKLKPAARRLNHSKATRITDSRCAAQYASLTLFVMKLRLMLLSNLKLCCQNRKLRRWA